MLSETGFKTPLLLNYTQWEAGQTGPVGMFGQNGSTTENYRVMAADPWGKPTVVWEARPDAASGPDGGWNSGSIQVDPNFYYRFSVWIRRNVIGNGSAYLGCYGSPAVLNLSNGSSNSNPYFWAGSVSSTEWVLYVGHVHPQGTAAGSPRHPDTGLYTVSGGRIGDASDFIFANGTTTVVHRSYLYYSTDTATRQQWAYPRVDKCDGTEPAIADLLAGLDSRGFDHIKRLGGTIRQAMSVDNVVKVGGVSEVGITNGLVAYYPLNKDAKDLSGNGYHGTVVGAVPVGGGFDGNGAYRFSSGSTYVELPHQMDYTNEMSAFAWFKGNGTPGLSHHIIMGGAALEISVPTSGQVRTGVVTDTRRVSNHGGGILDGNWHYVGFTIKSGVKRSFVDGVDVGTQAAPGQLVNAVVPRRIGVFGASTEYFANGDICNVKIFNRALSPEEVAVEYKRTGPTKMTQSNGTVYLQGQVKETT